MLRFSILTFATAFLFSCTSKKSNKPENSNIDSLKRSGSQTSRVDSIGYYKIAGDSLVIPPFEIEVSLSQKANERLKKGKESIIVWAYFFGKPKDTTLKEYLKSGGISLASTQIELTGDERVAKIENVKFSKSLYDSLADKDIQVLINVYSGRRSSPDNLLDCDLLEQKMSLVRDKKFTLKGKLIGEPGQ